jgi:hypothetical protein
MGISNISLTRNIANGGGCGNLEHFCPASSFVTVDSDEARKPPLAILPNVTNHRNKATQEDKKQDYSSMYCETFIYICRCKI